MGVNTEYTKYLICPICGHENRDTDGIDETPVREVCGGCGNEFWASANISISYSSEKVDWKLDGEKKIDRCSLCSNFEKVLKDYNGFQDYEKSCKKTGNSIVVNTDKNIAYNCPLDDTEVDDE